MPHIPEPSPDQEAEIARQASSSGDLGQAMYHAGTALGFDPAHRNLPEQALQLLASSVTERRRGNFDWAIHYASQAFAAAQDWQGSIAVACAYRDAGKIDDAVAWYRYALELDPKELGALLDIGDSYLQAQRYDEAIGVYGEVLGREPHHPWAEPSLAFAQHKKTGDPADKWRLLELSESSGRARSLFTELEPPQSYYNHLPAAADATANGIRNVMRHIANNPAQAQGGTVSLRVTHPESPSVLTAFQVWTQSRNLQVNLQIEAERVPSPDPRFPKAQVDFVLWSYEGTQPRPSLQQPDPRLADELSAIARQPFHLERWDPLAAALAARTGVDWLSHILGAMVFPPPLPTPDMDPLQWVQRVQLAAALTIGHLEPSWEGGARKRALYALALGPVDWSVDAAIVVLGWLARRDPAIRHDALQLFGWLEGQIPKEGYTSFEYPLVCTWLTLEGLDVALVSRLRGWKEHIEATHRAASDEPDQGPERHGGLALEPDVPGAQASAAAAAQPMAPGQGDSDPEVFPGHPIARLSQYVGLMKAMQSGGMMDALHRYGLDMGGYTTAAQAWGIKLAAEPMMSAKFSELMSR